MKTIKLPYNTNEDLTSVLKQYSNVVRYSYNRFLEGKTEKKIVDKNKTEEQIIRALIISLQNSFRTYPLIYQKPRKIN